MESPENQKPSSEAESDLAIREEVQPPSAAPGQPEAVGDSDVNLRRRLRRLTRRGFATGGVAALAGFAGWRWLNSRSPEDGIPWPFRRVLELDERVGQGAFRASRRSPEFARSAARMPRVNGMIGLGSGLDMSAWRLQVVGTAGDRASRTFAIDDIKALPRVEMTTELRCVEGWSEVVHWAGARLADLASATKLASRNPGQARETCSTTPTWPRPTASTTSGSTWPAPSIRRPCSPTRWTENP